MSNKTLNRSLSEVWKDEYVIPLYQRNFAWDETQIGQLLQDIYDHATKTKTETSQNSNYYIGSLVVLPRRDGKYEVIDGQQRLTALHLICRYLGILKRPRLTYDSRPEVERFLKDLFNSDWEPFSRNTQNNSSNKVARLIDALHIVSDYKIRIGEQEEYTSLSKIKEENLEQWNLLSDYINHKVILVSIPLPEDTDVASYFEIMNNRGEQLQAHEIIKAMMMKDINSHDDSEIFASIWEACSQMEYPIQRSLSKYRESGVFGDNFDTLNIDILKQEREKIFSGVEKLDIDSILSNSSQPNLSKINNDDNDEITYNAIIDFPNFLMHVFRLYKNDKLNMKCDDVPLNADYMPINTPYFISDPMDFAWFLLKVRTLYDKYVIKSQGEGEEDNDNLRWRILKPYKYIYQNNVYLKYRNTFTNKDLDDAEADLEASNSRIIKQQSMLQVTFRQKKYKDWLYEMLQWLLENTDEKLHLNEKGLISFLDNWIFTYYSKLISRWKKNNKDILTAGTDTPIFLLNFIDYLYWLASQQPQSSIRYVNEIKRKEGFQFRYFNSVEHHLPQSYEQTDGVNVNSIGNLCLISRRKNSSLNDKGPREKAKDIKGLQPKRLIMYKITWDNGKWEKREIEDHQQDIIDLLHQVKKLLYIE